VIILDEGLRIERIMYGDDCSMTLYQLSNGDIVNVDEAVNFVREGKLVGVVVGMDRDGQHYIRPSGSEYNGLK